MDAIVVQGDPGQWRSKEKVRQFYQQA